MPRKSKTQDYYEAKAIIKHGGKIDLQRLWAKDEDEEAEPNLIEKLIKQNEA